MMRIVALLLCLASAWLLYGLAMELFLAWYNGVEDQLDAMALARFTTQAIVDLAALVLFGRLAAKGATPHAHP